MTCSQAGSLFSIQVTEPIFLYPTSRKTRFLFVFPDLSDNMGADGRVNERIENYTKFWEKDSTKDTETERDNRLENYTDVINGMSHLTFFRPL